MILMWPLLVIFGKGNQAKFQMIICGNTLLLQLFLDGCNNHRNTMLVNDTLLIPII